MSIQADLLDAVYTRFREKGEWPLHSVLQIELRHLGNVAVLSNRIGSDLIACERHEGAICRLTLRGVAACHGSDEDVENFVRLVRELSHRAITCGLDSGLDVTQTLLALGVEGLAAKRATELIKMAGGVWRGWSGHPTGVCTITPHPFIWYYENVETLDDFFAASQRAREDEVASNQLPRWMRPVAEAEEVRADEHVGPSPAHQPFVDESRLSELRRIEHPSFDLTRLIKLCEELRHCSTHNCLLATAMLTRAIIDHVPPIFGVSDFAAVANNYQGSKAFKTSMKYLSTSARSIADGHLHVQIRKTEVLPSRVQVDFSRDLDVLLSEIVRILS